MKITYGEFLWLFFVVQIYILFLTKASTILHYARKKKNDYGTIKPKQNWHRFEMRFESEQVSAFHCHFGIVNDFGFDFPIVLLLCSI